MKNDKYSRREFLRTVSGAGLFLCGSGLFLIPSLEAKSQPISKSNPRFFNLSEDRIKNSPVAKYWMSTTDEKSECKNCHDVSKIDTKEFDHEETIIKCLLCAQGCIIKEDERGKCRARFNYNGKLKSLVYGHPVSIHVDPIEKKPLYHYHPGAQAFSLATAGCPLSCQFCQNWEISQSSPEDFEPVYTSPVKIVQSAKSKNAPIIAFTYNEPTVFTEYLIDIASEAKKLNINSVLISCGFMNSTPLADMINVLDAIKIDLKGFDKDFYRNVCKAELNPVLNTIKQIAKSKTHLEIVNLVVPTLNDSDKMLKEICNWIYNEVGSDVPVHFTKFHPEYKLLNLPPTPITTLERARNFALDKGLHYPYVGNVPGHAGNNTYCPKCGKIVINRSGFFVVENNIVNGKCKYCKTAIAGVWE
ncbi:MAG: AmmeMemoRadiSam system radical SAM enzyme [bacterium]